MFKNITRKSFLSAAIITLAMMGTGFYILKQKNKVDYSPFAISSDNLDVNIIKPNKVMLGTPEADLMVADLSGSKIFAKGGLNYVKAGLGNDELFYSMCSTKIIDKKVNVIEDFDPKNDKLKIFCAHNKITPEAVKVIHSKFDGKPVTYVQIQGKHNLTAIALLGNIDIKVSDIILNESW